MVAYRILNAEPEGYSVEAMAVLQDLGKVDARPLNRAELLAVLPEYDVLIVRLGLQVDREVLQRGRRLKAVVSATTGLDHIDLNAARELGVEVLSLRGEVDFLRSIPATAEMTWALLLALVRRIPAASRSVLAGEWERDRFRGHDLSGKRLGILGLGRVGSMVARYGLVFNMRVAAFDPHPQSWVEGVERLPAMDDLLARSQVLCVHVPLNEKTRSLIGAGELSRLPQGALLVNTSRGEVVDEAALVSALESGYLGGAALDVIAAERVGGVESSPLAAYARTHDNLLITPHIGGATWESMAATEVFMARKLEAFLRGVEAK
jgi:D-3-phosphoglycerate dehydrogenase